MRENYGILPNTSLKFMRIVGRPVSVATHDLAENAEKTFEVYLTIVVGRGVSMANANVKSQISVQAKDDFIKSTLLRQNCLQLMTIIEELETENRKLEQNEVKPWQKTSQHKKMLQYLFMEELDKRLDRIFSEKTKDEAQSSK